MMKQAMMWLDKILFFNLIVLYGYISFIEPKEYNPSVSQRG